MEKAQAIPHFGYSDEIDMTLLVQLKDPMKKAAQDRGLKFTYMAVFMKVFI